MIKNFGDKYGNWCTPLWSNATELNGKFYAVYILPQFKKNSANKPKDTWAAWLPKGRQTTEHANKSSFKQHQAEHSHTYLSSRKFSMRYHPCLEEKQRRHPLLPWRTLFKFSVCQFSSLLSFHNLHGAQAPKKIINSLMRKFPRMSQEQFMSPLQVLRHHFHVWTKLPDNYVKSNRRPTKEEIWCFIVYCHSMT